MFRANAVTFIFLFLVKGTVSPEARAPIFEFKSAVEYGDADSSVGRGEPM